MFTLKKIPTFKPIAVRSADPDKLPPFKYNCQEDPLKVQALAQLIPDAKVGFIFEKFEHFENLVQSLRASLLNIGDEKVFYVESRNILLAVSSRLLVRALAFRKIEICGIGLVVGLTEEIKKRKTGYNFGSY